MCMNLEEYNLNILDSASLEAILGMLATYSLVAGIICILMIVELWVIFKKCGKKGWLSIVPIANIWTLFTIVDLPGWLCLIPIANFVGIMFSLIKLPNRRFGKSLGFGIGNLLLPFVFLGVLAFSNTKEEGKDADVSVSNTASLEDTTSNQEASAAVTTDVSDTNLEIPSVDSTPDLMAAPTAEEIANPESEEKNFIVEEPALNLEETSIPVAPVIEPVINSEPEIPEANVINAFDMPAPVSDNIVINDIESKESEPVQTAKTLIDEVDTLPLESDALVQTKQETIIEPGVVPSPSSYETTESNVFDILTENVEDSAKEVSTSNIDSDLEATFELPKMANEIINSGITETKTCSNCGHVNEYTNKICVMCGSNLE